MTRAEERQAFERLAAGDTSVRDEIIEANLPFVVDIASGYYCGTVPFEDLVQEGTLGVVEAISRFDRNQGFKFISYAVWWIRHYMLALLADQGGPVQYHQNHNMKRLQIERVRRRMEQGLGRAVDTEEVLPRLGMAPKAGAMVWRHEPTRISLDTPVGGASEGSTLANVLPALHIEDDREGFDQAQQVQRLLETLETRHRGVVEAYYGLGEDPPMTLRQIGAQMGLTGERVRQILEEAKARMRRAAQLEAQL